MNSANKRNLVSEPESTCAKDKSQDNNPYRFHASIMHVNAVFGEDWFAKKAEQFARFFGTPVFLISQTAVVAIWIVFNIFGFTKFDLYPFILLNLAFSLQAAYAAPLILLAQTRQADRDKAHALADADHRESIAVAAECREIIANEQNMQILELLKQNTLLTENIRDLSLRIQTLTEEVHHRFMETSK